MHLDGLGAIGQGLPELDELKRLERQRTLDRIKYQLGEHTEMWREANRRARTKAKPAERAPLSWEACLALAAGIAAPIVYAGIKAVQHLM